jgi:regulator of sirC expression with transglutaminase-like and TPR domain
MAVHYPHNDMSQAAIATLSLLHDESSANDDRCGRRSTSACPITILNATPASHVRIRKVSRSAENRAAQRIADELKQTDPRLDLIALAIASLDTEPVDEVLALGRLDAWAQVVVERKANEGPAEALRGLLAKELKFTEDHAEYDAPANSFLPRVLARKKGLPVLVSLVYMEVARRAGIDLMGLGVPGRFVVGYKTAEGDGVVVIDPANGARVCSMQDIQMFASSAGVSASNQELQERFLQRAPALYVARRMLGNLVASFRTRKNFKRAAATLDLWLTAIPDDPRAKELYSELISEHIPAGSGIN